MTCLALALKGGGWGAVGLMTPLGEAKALETPPVSSEARAIFPTPTPQSEKNWRRVIRRRSSIDRLYRDGSNEQLIGFYSFVTVSSRFKIARQTVVQAASSGSSMGDLSSLAPATLVASASLLRKRRSWDS